MALPKHLAIIMDGNGRWAQLLSKPRTFGHIKGARIAKKIITACSEKGISNLTLYAFSTENWSRPRLEITALMELLVQTIRQETKTLNKNNIRLQAIGDLKSLPPKCYRQLLEAIELTKNNKRMTLVLALSYSSKWEIVNAVKEITTAIAEDKIKLQDIDENIFSQYLTTKNIPDPELLIRTSGENRISNFLLWQIAYAELYFTKTLWPDFGKNELYEAILDYQQRERRFGKTSEQLN